MLINVPRHSGLLSAALLWVDTEHHARGFQLLSEYDVNKNPFKNECHVLTALLALLSRSQNKRSSRSEASGHALVSSQLQRESHSSEVMADGNSRCILTGRPFPGDE